MERTGCSKGFWFFGIDNINSYYDINLKKDRINNLKKYKNFSFYKIDLSNYKKLNDIVKKNKINIIIHLVFCN